MSRKPRLDHPGAWHHVMHRGARRAPIFEDDAHCLIFLDTLQDMVRRYGVEVHAWSLMPNHYHLLVRSPLGNLSRAMRHLNGVYTQRINRRYDWDGPIFRGRFRSQLVEDERYQRYLVAYIHLNPVRAHLAHRPDEEAWTSHRQLVGLDDLAPWLSTGARDHLFGTPEQLHEFVRLVHVGRDPWPADMSLDFGWRQRHKPPPREPTPPIDLRPSIQDVLARVCRVTGATAPALKRGARGRGANPARRFAALMLMRQPGLSHADIAHALNMRPRQVSSLLHRTLKDGMSPRLAQWVQAWEAEESGVVAAD